MSLVDLEWTSMKRPTLCHRCGRDLTGKPRAKAVDDGRPECINRVECNKRAAQGSAS